MYSPKYKDSGVDIEAGANLVEHIKPISNLTLRTGAKGEIGGFGGIFDPKAAGYNDPILVASTDGVGTKLKIAIETECHSTIGIDLVAMCVNDLIVQGAEPLFFLDYFATGILNSVDPIEVVAGIAEGCKLSGCALIGGETAEMPGMYRAGDYDIAGFAVGAAERGTLLPKNNITPGDVILGLSSSGVHSNGLSLIRKILSDKEISFTDPSPVDSKTSWGTLLLTPTRIYVSSCLELHKAGIVKAFAHITGGGLKENIPRILPKEVSAEINAASWNMPPLFHWLTKEGNIEFNELVKTFNCGIGMAAIVDYRAVDEAIDLCSHHGETINIIGKITSDSAERVTFINLDDT